MTDITTVLASLCTIILFGTFLVTWLPRGPQLVIMLVGWGAMVFLFIAKYFFGHPVMAPVGRDLASWLGMATSLTSVAVCLLVVRKARRQQKARQARAQ